MIRIPLGRSLLADSSEFDYNYSWLIILGVFVVLGIILPCLIRAYRRRKYGLNVWSRQGVAGPEPAYVQRDPTAAEVSRAALATLPQDPNVQTSTSPVRQPHLDSAGSSSAAVRNAFFNQPYAFPATQGFRLSSAGKQVEDSTTVDMTNAEPVTEHANSSILNANGSYLSNASAPPPAYSEQANQNSLQMFPHRATSNSAMSDRPSAMQRRFGADEYMSPMPHHDMTSPQTGKQ